MSPSAHHNLTLISPSVLKPQARNARTHSKRQIKQIAASIEKFGFTNPVLVDDDNRILAGHGKVAAAKLLKLQEVPALRLADMSEADKRAYAIADNRLAEKAGWDREVLAIELQALVDLNFEVELTGFEMGEIDLILGEAAEAKNPPLAPEDAVPKLSSGRPVSQSGDLWILGPHRLFCGDSREVSCYERLMQGEAARLVITDPPYNVKIEGNVCGLRATRHREFAMASGEMSASQFEGFLKTVFKLLVQFSTPGSLHFLFMDWRHMQEMLAAGHCVYSELKNLVVWAKTNGGMGSLYRSQHELSFVWKAGDAPHINNVELGRHGRNRSNVWSYPGVNTFKPDRQDELELAPDGQTFRADRRRDQGLFEPRRHCPRPFLRLGHHSDRGRTHGSQGLRSRNRPRLYRCRCAPLASIYGPRRRALGERRDF